MRIIIERPESDSPLRGRIHLRGLSLRPTSNLLQTGGGPYIIVKDLLAERQAGKIPEPYGIVTTVADVGVYARLNP